MLFSNINQLWSQCTTGTNGAYPTAGYAAPSTCVVGLIATDAYTGEYTVINSVVSGNTYSFSSSNATDYITIVDQVTNTVLVHGVTPVNYTTLTSNNLIFWRHNNSTCTQESVNRSVFIACVTCSSNPATVQPSVAAVTQGAVNAQVLRIDVPACSGPRTISGVTLSTSGSTNAATDLVAAKLYYTTTTTFSTATPFGSAVVNPNGTFTFTGNQTIASGLGYFWLVYDLSCVATVTNVIDAACTSVTTSSGVLTPAVSNPTGTRAITAVAAASISTVQSLTTNVFGGTTNNIAVRVDIPGLPCLGNLTQLNLTNTSTFLGDVVKAKVFYTTTTTFNPSVQFGTDVVNPAATFSVNGSQLLAITGTNYFWVVYELACSAPATAANVMDGGLVSAQVSNAGTLTPVTPNPTGTRTIVAANGAYTTVSNGDWASPATWSCGNVPPDANTAVTINNLVTITTNVVAGNVTVALGASLIASSGSLTIGASSAGAASGNSNKLMTVNGTLTISGGTLNVNGGLTLAANSFLNISSGTINIDPNDGTSATSYTTTSAFLISTPNVNVTGGNINILDPCYSATAGAAQRSISYSVTTTNASMAAACTITLGGGDDTNPLNLNGFYLESIASSGTMSYGSIIMNGGDFASKRHLSAFNSNIYATSVKNLTVNSGSEVVLQLAGSIFAISGNLINNGVIINPNTANPTASCLAFVGNVVYTTGVAIQANPSAQSISGTGFFKKTTVELNPTLQSGNNTGNLLVFHTPTSPGLTLNMPLTVSNGIRLLEGKVNTSPTNFLALGNGVSIAGNPNALTETNGSLIGTALTAYTTSAAYDGGWVNGSFKRWFTATANIGQTGLLPVGFDTTNVAQILFTTAPTASGYITSQWIEGNSINTFSPSLNEPAVTPSVIDHNLTGMWDVAADNLLTGGNYTANFTDSKASGINDFANTTLLKRATNASPWALQGTHVLTSGTNINPTLSRTGLSGFSQFAVGSGLGPLVACSGIPTNLAIVGSTSSSGTISWTASVPAPLNGYDYYYSLSNTPPVASTIPSGNTASTSVTISNLPPNTVYYFWVRSNCTYPDVSPWSSVISFQTNPGTGCFSIVNSNISSICVGNNVVLTATGGPWVTIQWYTPAGAPIPGNTNSISLNNIQLSQAGLYTVTLTDATACVANASYQVNVNALPTATIGATPNPVCTGKTLNLTSGGGTTYSWTGPLSFTSTLQNPTRANILATHAGTYNVTVTSSAGCSSTNSVSVTVNASPVATINATPNPICTGNTLNLTSGGGTSYSWTGPASFTSTLQNPTRANVILAHSGNYVVSVTGANGCASTNMVSVTVNSSPTASASAAPASVCVGDKINLKANGGTTYQWSGPAGFNSNQQNPIRFNAQTNFAGVYTVTVSSGSGCSATSSVTVTVNAVPTVLPTATPSVACVGSTVQLTSGGGTSYMWTGPLGYTSTLQNPVLNITTYQQAGTYKVKVTNASGCSATFSVVIKVNYPPQATATYTLGTNCIGSNLALKGTGGGSYSWTGPNGFASNLQNPVINNVSAANSGLYVLVVTSPTGCSATVNLNIAILATPVVTATADDYEVCEGGTVYLHATGGTTYKWTGPYGWTSNVQHPIIYNIPSYLSGVYTVEVTNTGGCSTTASLVINVSNFINGSATATPNPANFGSNVQFNATGGVVYKWSGPNGFNSNDQNPLLYKVSSKNAGRYVVLITNAGGCQMTLFVDLSVVGAKGQDEKIFATGTKVADISLAYPNPAKDFIKIDYSGDKEIKYNIVNVNGIVVKKDAITSGGNIKIEDLAPGTYAIIWSENIEGAQLSVSKFIKVD